jgi:hypothetical protein
MVTGRDAPRCVLLDGERRKMESKVSSRRERESARRDATRRSGIARVMLPVSYSGS